MKFTPALLVALCFAGHAIHASAQEGIPALRGKPSKEEIARALAPQEARR